MTEPQPSSIAMGLTGLRSYVTVCCWIIGLSLAAQMLVWSLATFTEMRYREIVSETPPPMVVKQVAPTVRPASGAAALSLPQEIREAIEPGPIRVHTRWDKFFGDITTLSLATGSLAALVLVLLLAVAVNLMAASAMAGVDRAISSLVWMIIVAVVALPAAAALDLPWKGSALRAYTDMVEQVEHARATGEENFAFYTNFLFMPALCLAGIGVIGLRFGSAVRANLAAAHPFLDPELEAETANLRATSLHGGGGRSAGALDRLVEAGQRKQLDDDVAVQHGKAKSGVKAVSAGEAQRRLI